MTQLRRSRIGFSLIELLIVVAIIAALVGVAVPMFQQNIQEAHRAKAQADLETIRKAILQAEAKERAMTGISLDALKGRYIQDLPRDPWGNEYAVDLSVGVLTCFGGDHMAGGEGEDEDMVLRFRAGLKIARVTYSGAWGLPVKGARLKIQWTKPYGLAAADPLTDLVLIAESRASVALPLSGGAPFIDNRGAGGTLPPDMANLSWGGTTWTYQPARSDPTVGLMFVECTNAPDPSNPGPNTLRITAHMGVNVKQSVLTTGTTTSTSIITERATPGGPLDEKVFGSEALKPVPALPAELVGSENRGVLLQRE